MRRAWGAISILVNVKRSLGNLAPYVATVRANAQKKFALVAKSCIAHATKKQKQK
jgi:hypothetical protein